MGQTFRGGRPGFARRPLPIKHDHVGQMVYEERRAQCNGCGQRWWLKVETSQWGSRYRWVYLTADEDWPMAW